MIAERQSVAASLCGTPSAGSSMTALVQPESTPPSRPTSSPSPRIAGGGRFPQPTAEIERLAEAVLTAAKAGGATAAETEISQAVGQSVSVRRGEVETIAYNRDKGIGVTVYLGQRRGHASSADFSPEAIHAAVDKALTIARYTAEDPAAGLADPDRLAHDFPDLDLYHPWELAVEDAVAIGCEAEAAALAVDRRLTNTEGSTVAWNESEFVYANSLGFVIGDLIVRQSAADSSVVRGVSVGSSYVYRAPTGIIRLAVGP